MLIKMLLRLRADQGKVWDICWLELPRVLRRFIIFLMQKSLWVSVRGYCGQEGRYLLRREHYLFLTKYKSMVLSIV